MVLKSCFPFPSSRSYQVVFTEILARRESEFVSYNLVSQAPPEAPPRRTSIHSSTTSWFLSRMLDSKSQFDNLNSTIRQFDGNPRLRKLHRGPRRGGQVFIVQPLRDFFCLERWILNLNSTIQQFDNSTIQQSQFDNSTIRRQLPVPQAPPRAPPRRTGIHSSTTSWFFLFRTLDSKSQFNNSTIRQFNSSTIYQFTSSTIQQFYNSPVRQFNHSTISILGSNILILLSSLFVLPS